MCAYSRQLRRPCIAAAFTTPLGMSRSLERACSHLRFSSRPRSAARRIENSLTHVPVACNSSIFVASGSSAASPIASSLPRQPNPSTYLRHAGSRALAAPLTTSGAKTRPPKGTPLAYSHLRQSSCPCEAAHAHVWCVKVAPALRKYTRMGTCPNSAAAPHARSNVILRWAGWSRRPLKNQRTMRRLPLRAAASSFRTLCSPTRSLAALSASSVKALVALHTRLMATTSSMFSSASTMAIPMSWWPKISSHQSSGIVGACFGGGVLFFTNAQVRSFLKTLHRAHQPYRGRRTPSGEVPPSQSSAHASA